MNQPLNDELINLENEMHDCPDPTEAEVARLNGLGFTNWAEKLKSAK